MLARVFFQGLLIGKLNNFAKKYLLSFLTSEGGAGFREYQNNVDLTPIKSPDFLVKNYIPTVWRFIKTKNLTAQHFSWFAEKGQALELAALDNTERPSHENSAT